MWALRPFRLDVCCWASTPERPNRQHCHPYGNKNKKSPLSPSSRIAAMSPSILEPTLHARIAVACSIATALPRPPRHGRNAAACCTMPEHRRLLSCLPTATHHTPPSSSSRYGIVHDDCSGAVFFTTPNRLPPTILPLHCTQAPLAGYHRPPLGRP
jgi:hypothetical protein